MPATSRKQFKLMKACEHDAKACPGGMTPEKAKEFTKGRSPKSLPEKKGTKKKGGT